jgi:hypothetical protein
MAKACIRPNKWPTEVFICESAPQLTTALEDGPHGSFRRYKSFLGGAMENRLAFLLLAVVLGGCATTYQPTGFSGGYSQTQLGENIFRVSFRGNAYTSGERAADFTLLRSAELAAEHGFRYFVVVESASDSSVSMHTTPTQSYTTGSAYAIGNTAYGSARTTTYGGQTYVVRKPSTTNTILCFREKPDVAALVFDVEFIQQSIKQKYGIAR